MNLSNPKSRFLFAAIIIVAGFSTISGTGTVQASTQQTDDSAISSSPMPIWQQTLGSGLDFAVKDLTIHVKNLTDTYYAGTIYGFPTADYASGYGVTPIEQYHFYNPTPLSIPSGFDGKVTFTTASSPSFPLNPNRYYEIFLNGGDASRPFFVYGSSQDSYPNGKAYYSDFWTHRWTCGFQPYFNPEEVCEPGINNGIADIFFQFGTAAETLSGKETAITTEITRQESAVVDGDIIAWKDNDYVNLNDTRPNDIYVYEISTGRKIRVTNDNTQKDTLLLAGRKILWTVRDINNQNAIFIHDLDIGITTEITTEFTREMGVRAISILDFDGQQIAWQTDYEGSVPSIYVYNLATSQSILIDRGAFVNYTSQVVSNPKISGNKILYKWFWNCGTWCGQEELRLYDIATGEKTKILNNYGFSSDYAIDGDNIVVVVYGQPSQIYRYKISTGEATPISSSFQQTAGIDISGDMVVWSDTYDIFMYDLVTGKTGRTGMAPKESFRPKVSGNTLVWEDYRAGGRFESHNIDIYMYQIKDGAPPPPPNQPPVALFTFWPENPKAGEEIYFDASSSYDPDPDGSIVRYEWDWDDDGVYDDSLESATVSMQWPLGGSFTVLHLRVIDNNGAEAVFTVPLLVSDTPKSELAAFIVFAFRDAGNTRLWQNIAFDTPIIKYLFPSYRKFRSIDKWLREDANGSVSGNPLDWLKEDQRFADFAPYVTTVDIVTLLEEQIPGTNMSYAGRIETIISEYRLADYALLRDQRTDIGLKQAMQTFKKIGEQLVRWIPLVGDLIAGDPVDEALLKETIKTGTKVAMAEILIRKGFEETHATDLSGSGVNLAWMAYKAYAGIRDLDNTAKLQTYENGIAAYFACLQRGPGVSGGGDHLYCWQQTRQDDENSFSSVLADEDEEEFKNMWERYGNDWEASGVSTAKLEELQNAVKEMVLDALQQYKQKFPDRLIVDVNSPVEIRVIDPQGAIVGVVGGSIKNEIPYSVYDGESETVTVILPSDGSSFELVGTGNGTYEVTITSVQEGVVRVFKAIDIPIKVDEVHKYTIDWDVLSRGEKGVTLQMDADGDGVFEQTIKADATLQPPTADINGPYEGNEGSPIIFDASGSSDPDGEIILYEWDFDGDGVYDIASTSPTAEHIWGDDYQGEIILRVTDDEGLTDTAATSVIVKNVAPIISNLSVNGPTHPNQEIWAGDGLNFSGDFADDGWLDIHTAEWDFGNGTTAIGAIIQENNPPPVAIGQVTGNHIYYDAGTYIITLAVTDDDGGVSANTFQIAVKPIPAVIDCNPDTLNLKSGGKWITCYIELPAGYDVRQIDGSAVFLNGAIPIYLGKEGWAKPESNKANIMDHDEDGILERMVKFDREAVQDILKPEEAAILTAAGKVFYNQGLADFEGQDTIRVIEPDKPDKKEKLEKQGKKQNFISFQTTSESGQV